MDVDRLLAEEESTWHELLELIGSIPQQRLEEPTVTPAGWSVKDVMFHIGAWAADCANQLERMRVGTFEDHLETREAIELKNREWFELSQTMDLATVRTEFVAARTKMLQEWAALGEVTPAAWEWLEESGPIHYRKHVDDMRRWAG